MVSIYADYKKNEGSMCLPFVGVGVNVESILPDFYLYSVI